MDWQTILMAGGGSGVGAWAAWLFYKLAREAVLAQGAALVAEMRRVTDAVDRVTRGGMN